MASRRWPRTRRLGRAPRALGVAAAMLAVGIAGVPAAGATPITLASTEFSFFGPVGPNFVTVGGGHDEPIGDFVLPVPPELFPAPGDPGPWAASFVSITMSVRDGDTATPEEIDFGDLTASLGVPGTDRILNLPLELNGLGNEILATATNELDLSGSPELGIALAALLSETTGSVRFFVRDTDEGGNRLDFSPASPEDFFLRVDLERVRAVPAPATAGLLAAGLAGLGWLRRRSRAGDPSTPRD